MSDSLFDLSREKREPPKKRVANDDAKEDLRKMQEKHTQITKQLEEVYQKAGIDAHELSSYCQNPDNFTEIEWQKYQQGKERVEMDITGLTKEDLHKKKERKEKTRVAKERRGKTLGSRKNWLNMR